MSARIKMLVMIGALLLAGLLSASSWIPEGHGQDMEPDRCYAILDETARRMGWAPGTYELDRDAYYHCRLDVETGGQKIHIDLSYKVYDWETDCTCNVCRDSNVCECTQFHGNEGEYMPGHFLRFCDSFCQMSISIEAQDDPSVDFYAIAEALYASAQEVGCFQLTVPPQNGDDQPPIADPDGTEILPPDEIPGDVIVDPGADDDVPIWPDDNPPGQDFLPGRVDVGRIARNPLVSLSGALLGTLLGVLVSLWRVFFPTAPPLRTLQPPTPPGPHDWNQWEQTLPPPPQEAGVAEPLPYELKTHLLDLDQTRDTILDQFREDILSERKELIDPERVHYLQSAEFERHYQQTFKQPNADHVTGFMDPNTLQVYIDLENCNNYTSVHEVLHLTSNPHFSARVKTGMDEGVTEYFTVKLANKNQVVRSSLYTINDSYKAVDDMAKLVGEAAVRRAYFGDGPGAVDELRILVDQQLRPGAFDKISSLMEEGKHLRARQLLSGINLPPKP